jgi:hypothetical protein
MDKPSSTSSRPERRTKPISQQEKELTEALDFLVSNLQLHAEEYHHTTDARKVKRCESTLEEAISELIARKEERQGQAAQPGGGKGNGESARAGLKLVRQCYPF